IFTGSGVLPQRYDRLRGEPDCFNENQGRNKVSNKDLVEAAGVEISTPLITRKLLNPDRLKALKGPQCRIGGTKSVQQISARASAGTHPLRFGHCLYFTAATSRRIWYAGLFCVSST